MHIKSSLLLFAMLFIANSFYAQVGIGTTNPSPAAMLEVSSQSNGTGDYKGFMPPRVPNTIARDAIAPGVSDYGLIVYVLDNGSGFSCLQMWVGDSWIDVTCNLINTAPFATDVDFSGLLQLGSTLTASFTYNDADSDPAGAHTYNWYTASDASGTGQTLVQSGTSDSYVTVAADDGKFVAVEVTPVATTGESPGIAVLSDYQGPITSSASQLLASWDFLGNSGSEATVNATVVTGIDSGVVSRGAGINAANNSDRFNANNFTQPTLAGAVANNDYFQFTITPTSGNQISITEVFFNYERSGTGPTEGALRSSVDGYTTNLATFTGLLNNSSHTVDLSGAGITNQSSTVTFRLYLYGNTNADGSAGFEGSGNDLEITGTIN